jgi:hypothetical protein
MTIINTNAHICLLNDLKSILSLSTLSFSLVELSPDAIKALENAREGWLASRNQDFPNLLLMTKLVAGGVILEGPELVYELWKVIRRWKKRVVPEHAPYWITLIGLVGWVFVAVGVAGEFWVDGKVNLDDENIQSINITLLKDATASASQSKIDAKTAHDEATAAKGEADAAVKTAGSIKGEVDSAKATADIAKSQVDGAKRDADAVSKEVKEARAELGVVEAFVSARHIIDTKPFDKLKAFKRRELTLISNSGDEEAREFCLALADRLRLVLAWKSSPPDSPVEWPIAGCGAAGGGGNGSGVLVGGPDTEFVTALANAIQDATGVPVLTSAGRAGQHATSIIIGTKSPGFFRR